MQQKKSVVFEDWKDAFRQGFDGFILQCGSATAQNYIEKFSELSEVKETPVFRSDGVHVKFHREKPAEEKIITDKMKLRNIGILFTAQVLVVLLIFSLIPEPTVIVETEPQSKSIIVQGNIIPRDCYMIPSKFPAEPGWSIMVNEIDGDFRAFIEVDDYDLFLKEYLEKK